jgi:hypothetical protein
VTLFTSTAPAGESNSTPEERQPAPIAGEDTTPLR